MGQSAGCCSKEEDPGMWFAERFLKHPGSKHSRLFVVQRSASEEARPCGAHETIQAQPTLDEDVEKVDERKAVELFIADRV